TPFCEKTRLRDSHAPWYEGVMLLRDDHTSQQSALVADYLLFLLFTGLRRKEAATLKWSDIDLRGLRLQSAIPRTGNLGFP
ncbi:MAG TPA: hypothetical protein VIU43_02935, partial [Nitrosospira sp.]